MKLIADSGSTKTTWALLENGELKTTVSTPGLNPYFLTSEVIEATLRSDLAPNLPCDFIREIHFYGAGCSTENNNNMLKEAIKLFFRKADVFIYHDILGAARALFGKGEGIACILGTGATPVILMAKKLNQGFLHWVISLGMKGLVPILGKFSWKSI